LGKLPLLRFLCIDPDAESLNTAVRGAPEVALSRNEIYHLPLQPVGNYRRRSIDQLSEWLPREKLYALPARSSRRGRALSVGWPASIISSGLWPGCGGRSRKSPIPTSSTSP